MTRGAARERLRALGWSYRTVAPVLGVCYVHLCFVLTGRRQSRRLLDAIADLPPRTGAAVGKGRKGGAR